MGLLAISVAKALGAKRVTAVDIVQKKLDLAKKMGAEILLNSTEADMDEEVNRLTDGDGFDRICEASGKLI